MKVIPQFLNLVNSKIMSESLILKASKKLAHHYHAGITRKYPDKETGIRPPYVTHTDGVREIVRLYGGTDIQQAAADLHDVLEDVLKDRSRGPTTLLEALVAEANDSPTVYADSNEVLILVQELTNVYTSERYPNLNKNERNLLEAARLKRISAEGKLVKMADIIYNAQDIVENDPGYAPLYLKALQHKLWEMYTGTNEQGKQYLSDIFQYADGVINHQFNKLKFYKNK